MSIPARYILRHDLALAAIAAGFTMPETLRTARLTLTRLSLRDRDGNQQMYCEEETARFIGGVTDPAGAYERLAMHAGHWVLRGCGSYALRLTGEDEYLGGAGIWFPHGWPELEIAYGLMPEARGKSYATEAVRAIRDAAWHAGAPSLVSYIDPRNVASQRVAKAAGAQAEATVCLSGKPCTVWRYPRRRAA